ncbi:MAG: hypothetical protein ABEI78_01705, partial [Candidatus Nanohaloarchaea archaeon]
MTYTLKKNVKRPYNSIGEKPDSSKSRNSVNLLDTHWAELDRVKEEKDLSRSKILRDILEAVDIEEA